MGEWEVISVPAHRSQQTLNTHSSHSTTYRDDMSLIEALRAVSRNADQLPDDPDSGLPALLGCPGPDAALLLADLLRTLETALTAHAAVAGDDPPPGWARLPDGQLAPLPIAKLSVGGSRPATTLANPLLASTFLAARYATALARVRSLRARIADDLPLEPADTLKALTPSRRPEWGLRDLVDALREALQVLEQGAPHQLPLSTRSGLGSRLTT